MLTLAAAAQTGSEHPLARAVLAHASGLSLPPIDEFQSHTGLGLTARVDGRLIAIGNRKLLKQHGIAVDGLVEAAERLEDRGRTVMWIAALAPLPELLGIIAVADPVKPTARKAIRQLQRWASAPCS